MDHVRLTGRFDLTRFEGARFAWPGSAITVRFSGTALEATLLDSGHNQFNVLVDGRVHTERFAPGRGKKRIRLVSDLDWGEHELTLYRRTEAFLGESEFIAVESVDGTLLAPPMRPARKLILIGDSISAGYGNEAEHAHASFVADTENHYLTYGAIAARNLGAELVTLAWSGKGVYSNAGAPGPTMPELFQRTLPEREDSRWDVASDSPDAVIINLGSNDLSPSTPDPRPFGAHYRDFLAALCALYPRAQVLCTQGPCLHGSALLHAREAIQTAVAVQADPRVSYLEYAEIRDEEGHGADFHPSLRTHARMADALTAALTARLSP